MTNRTTSADRPAAGESKAALFGAALMVGIGLIVIGSGVVLTYATIVLGDTAFVMP